MSTSFEQFVRDQTLPINGQFPRLWMTDFPNPESARVFTVGMNPVTAYLTGRVTHSEHTAALLNRDGRACRALYTKVRAESSPTRGNIDDLTDALRATGIPDVLETNVVCYSTPSSSDLSNPEHRKGRDRGIEVFKAIVTRIQPQVLIVHGSKAVEFLGRSLDHSLQSCKHTSDHPPCHEVLDSFYFDARPLHVITLPLTGPSSV